MIDDIFGSPPIRSLHHPPAIAHDRVAAAAAADQPP